MKTKIAVIQRPPVFLDREKTINQALEQIDEAAGEGTSLLVFPEAYIPGYPTWIWRLRPGGDMTLCGEIHARLRQNSVDLARGDLQPERLVIRVDEHRRQVERLIRRQVA